MTTCENNITSKEAYAYIHEQQMKRRKRRYRLQVVLCYFLCKARKFETPERY